MFNAIKAAIAVLVFTQLCACSSSVTRLDGLATPQAQRIDISVQTANVRLSEGAKQLAAQNLPFNQEAFRATIERSLREQNLIKDTSRQSLDIEITYLFLRSEFSAVMFGFMAGNDTLEGVVTLKDADGRVLKRAKVSAWFALGGFRGLNSDRMTWLYEEFSKHAVAELTGVSAK